MLQSVFFSFVAEGGKGFGSDKQELKKLGDWEPLVIIKAPAKKYQWEHLGYRGYFLKANLAKDTFEIEPNSLNYIGDIYVKTAINSKNKYVGHISGKDNFLEVKKQITASFPEASNNYSILNKTSIPRFRESSK